MAFCLTLGVCRIETWCHITAGFAGACARIDHCKTRNSNVLQQKKIKKVLAMNDSLIEDIHIKAQLP